MTAFFRLKGRESSVTGKYKEPAAHGYYKKVSFLCSFSSPTGFPPNESIDVKDSFCGDRRREKKFSIAYGFPLKAFCNLACVLGNPPGKKRNRYKVYKRPAWAF